MPKPDILTGPIRTKSTETCPLNEASKQDVLELFESTYSTNEWLFTSIADEAYFYKRPDRLRLPLIFYYAHTAVFYINKYVMAGILKERVNEDFEALFEAGVDEMSWDDTENCRAGGRFKWPDLADVVEYRRQVRNTVRSAIQNLELILPVKEDDVWWSVWMSIEHERCHFETSSVLIRQLPLHMVTEPVGWTYGPLCTDNPVLKNPMLKLEGGNVHLGKDKKSPLWGWDCEFGSEVVRIPPFRASKYMVTNRQMLEFVQQGGYENASFWSADGWKWKSKFEIRHPAFWVCDRNCSSNCGGDLSHYSHCARGEEHDGGVGNGSSSQGHGYKLRVMFQVVPLPLDWPVEVTFHEAKAFCAWTGDGHRLPTEAEESVIRGLPRYDVADINTEPVCRRNVGKQFNIDLTYGSSTPVNFYPESPAGFHDVMGNAWKWIEDHFNGLQGFKTNVYYDNFTTPSCDGKHSMIMGGSWASLGQQASRFARLGFRRHFMQHAGFRLARTECFNDPTPFVFVETPVYNIQTNTIDEQERVVTKGLVPLFRPSSNPQFVADSERNVSDIIMERYKDEHSPGSVACHKRIAALAREATCESSQSHVLHVGSGTGTLCFELSKDFDHVLGCDTSAHSVYVALQLQRDGRFTMEKNEGREEEDNILVIPEDCHPERVTFKELSWIPFELKKFNILVNTMLDRSLNPKAWLISMKELVNRTASGRLILLSKDWNSDRLEKLLNPMLNLTLEEAISLNGHGCLSLTVWKSSSF